MHILNKTQIRELLTIPDYKQETIYGIVGRMKVLLAYFEKDSYYQTLLPFLKTYYYVTKASAEKYIESKHFFYSLEDYQTLDVYFATLYFQPLLHYVQNGAFPSPWQHYFEYCSNTKGHPILKIMLGVNAHINTDLYASLVHLKYTHQKDFLLVNSIIKEVTPNVMKFLIFSEHDILGLTGYVLQKFIMDDFQNLLVRWRQDAWDNAVLTNHTNEKAYYCEIVQKTEDIAQVLIQDTDNAYHLNHPETLISHLHSLSTRLAM